MPRHIIALIPAVTEPGIHATIRSLLAQTVPPDRVVVAVNNAHDRTTHDAAATVQDPRVEVLDLGQVHGLKAGALNMALAAVAPRPQDLVLAMDADTVMVPGWIERALQDLQDPDVGAVGAVFRADTDRGWLHGCQAREWARYAEEIDRTGRTFVLSGTAALIRMCALQDVHRAHGRYYDTQSITEDMRLTLDLLGEGWRLTSPVECATVTETMPTVRLLFKQRRRWSRGAVQNVTRLGLTRVTRVYWQQQALLALSIACMGLCLVLTVVLTPLYGVDLQWWSLAIVGAFAVERVATVWDAGTRHRVVAGLVVPELVYALVLQAAHVHAVVQHATNRTTTWNHV